MKCEVTACSEISSHLPQIGHFSSVSFQAEIPGNIQCLWRRVTLIKEKGCFLKSFKFKALHLSLAFNQNLVPAFFWHICHSYSSKHFLLSSLCLVLTCGWMIAGIPGVCLAWFMGIREISLNPQPTTNYPLQIVLYNTRFYEDSKALRLELSMPGVVVFIYFFW